ncbi:MAG: M20 family metallopeptidase [Alistipes senegalensis]|nr:M20 family metallopeptidase [Bacteroides cellulosilyticus]MCM1351905.1 M20 family metallopeptidase [Alistipes senegalensis]
MTPVEFRRHLHAHPELSFREEATAAFITEQLTAAGIECRPIARTGVLARIEGRNLVSAGRPAVVLRADIDALPIAERTGLACCSQNEGVMHACGHDIHAAVLFGVLQHLAAAPDFAGTVFGLFQPGEECNPGGASLVLAENPFEGYDVRAVVGEHVEPQLEVGTLGFRAGKYMAANDELRFRVHGAGGHGALRTQLKDPVAAAAELISALLGLNDTESVLSIGRVEAAGATNVVPDEVCMEGTLRTFDEAHRDELHRRITDTVSGIDRRHGTHTDMDIDRGYPCVVNDTALVELSTTLAKQSGLLIKMLPLRPTAEDFGYYCRRYPSLFYRLGVGAAADRTHTATFAPDERAIDVGIGFMHRLALLILKQS